MFGARFDIVFGKGIDTAGELVDLSVEHGIILRTGAWYTYMDAKLNGRDKMKNYLQENPDVFSSIKEKVMEKLYSDKK